MSRILTLSGALAFLALSAHADGLPDFKDLDPISQNYWLDSKNCTKSASDACAEAWDTQKNDLTFQSVKTGVSSSAAERKIMEETAAAAKARQTQVLGVAEQLADVKDYPGLGQAVDAMKAAASPSPIDDRVFGIWLNSAQLERVKSAETSYAEFQAFPPEKQQRLLTAKLGVLPPASAVKTRQKLGVYIAAEGRHWQDIGSRTAQNGAGAFDGSSGRQALADPNAAAAGTAAAAAATAPGQGTPAALGGVQEHLQSNAVPGLAPGQAPTQAPAQAEAPKSGFDKALATAKQYAKPIIGAAGVLTTAFGVAMYGGSDSTPFDALASNAPAGPAPDASAPSAASADVAAPAATPSPPPAPAAKPASRQTDDDKTAAWKSITDDGKATPTGQ